MKLSRLLHSIFLMGTIQLSLFTNAIAGSQNDYAAAIYFPSEATAKWLVYNAYSSLSTIDNKLDKLIHPAIQSLDGTRSSSDRYYLDLKFQSHKHDLDESINKSKTWFSVFNNEDITVEINDDGYGNHLVFNIPKLHIGELGIIDDLTSVENANLAITHLNAAKDKINSILPSEMNEAALAKFIAKKPVINSGNHFYVASGDDSKHLLRSLNQLNNLLINNLDHLLAIANEAATGKHSQQEMLNLDTQFQALLSELSRLFATNCNIGDIKLFNDNKLEFKAAGMNRAYQFTTLNLDVLNIKNDNIVDTDSAFTSFFHLLSIRSWIRDWDVTGDAPFEVSKNKNTEIDMSVLNLTNNEKVILQKVVKH